MVTRHQYGISGLVPQTSFLGETRDGVGKMSAVLPGNRVFSHDVTAAMLVSQTSELNSFLMQTLSFVPINLHGCWPRE